MRSSNVCSEIQYAKKRKWKAMEMDKSNRKALKVFSNWIEPYVKLSHCLWNIASVYDLNVEYYGSMGKRIHFPDWPNNEIVNELVTYSSNVNLKVSFSCGYLNCLLALLIAT